MTLASSKNLFLGIEREQWREMDLPIHSQCTLSLPPENIRKPCGFLMFSGGREKVHWERMG